MGAHRAQVWAKTNGICWYCGKAMNPFEDFEEEHQNPKIQGGADELENLQPACTRCNRRKKGRTVEEYRQYLVGNGALRFWGEMQTPGMTEEENLDPDDREPTIDDLRRVLFDCLYIRTAKGPAVGNVLIAFVSRVWSWWFEGKKDDGTLVLKGLGDFTFEMLGTVLQLPKYQLLTAICCLDQLGIITSPAQKPSEEHPEALNFRLNTVLMHQIAMECAKSYIPKTP